MRFKSKVEESDAFARRREEVPVERVAERLNSVRIARDEHFPKRVQIDERVRPVETDRFVRMKNRFAANFHEIAFAFFNCRAKIMHEDFRVGIARETRVRVELQELLFFVFVVRQLPVEGEAKPFVFLNMGTFERMRVIHVVAPARRVSHMTYRRRPRERVHDPLELIAMILMERFRDGSYFLVRFKGFRTRRVVRRNSR